MDFHTLAAAIHKKRGTQVSDSSTILLCFDPGHTTGWALFGGIELLDSGELQTQPIETAVETIGTLVRDTLPKNIVLEDYRVYKWRAKHHVGSEMLTTRVIGVIETFAVIQGVAHIVKQPAHVAKGFCTDKKLKEWGFYKPGEKHARDAIRHGAYFLLYGAIDKKQQTGGTVG